MSSTIPILQVRRRLGRQAWQVPEPFGPDGWTLVRQDGAGSIIVTAADHDGVEWLHASVAGREAMPTYADLVQLHAAVWPAGHAYQCFVPPAEHINIHGYALHLWGRADGARVLPDFGALGSI